MRLFLDELNGETINAAQLRSNPENLDKADTEFVRDRVDGSCPKCSKNSFGCLDCIASSVKNSAEDRRGISETLLGSFLASVLWLKKRELSKASAGEKEKITVEYSTVRLIQDMCEMLGGFLDSESNTDECWSATEEQRPRSEKTSGNASTSLEPESNDSESAFLTPPPSPPPSFFELKPKASVTCMGDLTKEKKKSVSTGTDDASPSVAVRITEEIKSTIKYLQSKAKTTAAAQPIKTTNEEMKKLPNAVEFTVAANTVAGVSDIMAMRQVVLQSYSSDSVDTIVDFDSDDPVTSSLSGEDEMEEFADTRVAISQSDSKAICPRGSNAPLMTTYKTPKPSFFEVWKRYPKLSIQEVITRTAKVKRGEGWEVKKYKNAVADQILALVPGEKREKEVVIENSHMDLVIYIQVEVEDDDKTEELVVDFKTNSLGTQTSDHEEETNQRKKSVCDISKKCGADESVTSDRAARSKVGKTVTFGDEVSEIFVENPPNCERKRTANAVAIVTKEEILTANVHLEQREFHSMHMIECPKPFYRPVRNVELEKALQLIREIENDVVDTKLSDAILILPRLETELRKHFKRKVKSLGDPEVEKSLDTFFSAFDIWSIEVTDDAESGSSEERLYNLMTLLGDLENAVKASEGSTKFEPFGCDSSKIYDLLHALTESIRELEDCATVTSLSQTLDIASKLDTAVREYDSVTKTPTEYVAPVPRNIKRSNGETFPLKHLKNVRKKVFEMVEQEAVDREARLEKDSERLESLERENDEAMKFVETFLQKTQRRAAELGVMKTDLMQLSAALDATYEELAKKTGKSREKSGAGETVKETVSGLLLALDNLKSRAREKNELCREILSRGGVEKEIKSDDASTRSSKSSFTAKNVEDLSSWVKDFKKIGDRSLYLSWTKPEGPFADSLAGYEIFVNGKLNQKVRNPQRLQAVLYSVDLSKRTEVLLYGLLENGFRIFLSTVTYATS